jgi:hypothetical protein
MSENKNKVYGDKPLSSIVSDVPLGDPEHDRLIHEFAEGINKHVDDKPDAPKIKNRCGTCLAYHTPFCVWEYKDYDKETMKALHVDADATACSSHYAFKLRAMHDSERSFQRKVQNL